MRYRITSTIDANKILADRGLGPASDKAVKFLASTVKRFCDPYVPMDSGALKNTAIIAEDEEGVYILYDTPYAHYQYYGEVMAGRAPKHYTGIPLTYQGAPMRGAHWDTRMLADRGGDVATALAKYVGGEVK